MDKEKNDVFVSKYSNNSSKSHTEPKKKEKKKTKRIEHSLK